MLLLDVALGVATLTGAGVGGHEVARRRLVASTAYLAAALAAGGWLAHNYDVARVPLLCLVGANALLLAGLIRRR